MFCLGALLSKWGRAGTLFLLSSALLGLLLLAELLNPGAYYGDGYPLTYFAFVIVFVWLPALWTGFVITATAIWAWANFCKLRTDKRL